MIYTPGDNEWVDCLKPKYVELGNRYISGTPTPEDLATIVDGLSLEGGYARKLSADGFSSLASIRKTFFATNKSLGSNPITLTRQADVSEFDEMVENSIWTHEEVVFGTEHVTGSDNNFFINDRERALESITRNKANVEWIKRIFGEAQGSDAKPVVIALHAGMFDDRRDGEFTGLALRGGANGPFYWIVLAIRDLAAEFGRPVLLVHGDFHEFEIDRPFMVSAGESAPPKYANITRLQVYGAPEIKAVRVSVDPDTPWVFSFSPAAQLIAVRRAGACVCTAQEWRAPQNDCECQDSWAQEPLRYSRGIDHFSQLLQDIEQGIDHFVSESTQLCGAPRSH